MVDGMDHVRRFQIRCLGEEGRGGGRKTMSEKDSNFHWKIMEFRNKIKILRKREREREIVKEMSEVELRSLHEDYLAMRRAEADEKK